MKSIFANDPGVFNPNCSCSNRSGPWIGVLNVLGPTNFEWVTGEPVTFTNWGPSEPFGNGRTTSYTDCTSPFGDGSGTAWNVIGPEVRSDGLFAYIREASIPGCPLSATCRDHPRCDSTLTTFYELRDDVLRGTISGQYFVDLYYCHALELTQILISDAELRKDTKELVFALLPTVRQRLSGDVAVLSTNNFREIDRLIRAYQDQASHELSLDLLDLRRSLRSGDLAQVFGFQVKERYRRMRERQDDDFHSNQRTWTPPFKASG